MKKKNINKLNLSRETLQNLTAANIAPVVGGQSGAGNTCAFRTCRPTDCSFCPSLEGC
jgi:hypothetical protein